MRYMLGFYKSFFLLTYNFFIFLVFAGVISARAADIPPQIYINDQSVPIVVQRGQPVRVPLFIIGGSWADSPNELFIWYEQGEYVRCLGPGGWIDVSDPAQCIPLGQLEGLPPYIHFNWDMFTESQSLTDLFLHVCIDNQIDQVYTPDTNTTFCGQQLIQIQGVDCSESAIEIVPGGIIAVGPLAAGAEEQRILTISDVSGKPISFEIVEYPDWINPTNNGNGQLSLNFKAGSLAPDTYTDWVTIRTIDGSDTEENISVSLEVTGSNNMSWSEILNNRPAIVFDFSQNNTTNTSCSTLGFIPSGSTTIPYTSITEKLPLDDDKTIYLDVDKCGTLVSVSDVDVIESKGGDWLTATKTGSQVILTLDAGISGLVAGSSYEGKVKVTAGGLSTTLTVKLKIEGICVPSQPEVSSSSIDFVVNKDQTPTPQALTIKDNCGINYLESSVSKVETTDGGDWLIVKRTGTGKFSVECSATGSSVVGKKYATITFNVTGYDTPELVNVTLEVRDTNSSGITIKTITLPYGEYYDLEPGDVLYFKFQGKSDPEGPIIVNCIPASGQPATWDLLVKKGERPNFSDWKLITDPDNKCYCSSYIEELDSWSPPKPAGAEDLYYCLNGSVSSPENFKIEKSMPKDSFYIMLYNWSDTKKVRRLRLSVNDLD